MAYYEKTQLSLKMHCYGAELSYDVRVYFLEYLKNVTSCRKLFFDQTGYFAKNFASLNINYVEHLEIHRSFFVKRDIKFIQTFTNLKTIYLIDVYFDNVNSIDKNVSLLLNAISGTQKIL